jgi:transcriptional regulator with XRE-family HTH domain
MPPKRTINPRFGTQLRKLRQHRGMTTRQLAKAAGVSPTLISKMETGKQRIVAEHIGLFATILRCRPGAFFKDK